MTGVIVAASVAACGEGPVAAEDEPRVTLGTDSLTLNMFTAAPVSAAVSNTAQLPQYVSRDPKVATVNGAGVVTGVGVGATYVIASLPGRPKARDSAYVRVYSDSCGGARPDFGGAATAADRALFSYDVEAPLNLQQTFTSATNGVEVSSITFNSPDGGVVSGILWEPVTRSGPRPAVILMHGLPGDANAMAGLGQIYAKHGAVVIAISAPWNRRQGAPLTFTPQDRVEQIQVVKDLQRAVDVLRARTDVDKERIAYVGGSWGGATGALFVGIERRLRAAVLMVGHAGQVSHATGPEGFKHIAPLSCARRVAWMRAMAPVEPVRYVGNANVPLLLQNGKFDEYVPVYEAEELHAAAPQPKDVRWYNAGHNLGQQGLFDVHDWLVQQIGLDPR